MQHEDTWFKVILTDFANRSRGEGGQESGDEGVREGRVNCHIPVSIVNQVIYFTVEQLKICHMYNVIIVLFHCSALCNILKYLGDIFFTIITFSVSENGYNHVIGTGGSKLGVHEHF